jgi:hypothetical protein
LRFELVDLLPEDLNRFAFERAHRAPKCESSVARVRCPRDLRRPSGKQR